MRSFYTATEGGHSGVAQVEIRELCLQATATEGLLGEIRDGVNLELPEKPALSVTGV